jgi:hypothetical protein
MTNRFIFDARISERKIQGVIEDVLYGRTAADVEQTGWGQPLEIDESYLGPRRVRGPAQTRSRRQDARHRTAHVNGIESFWSYTKFRFIKLRGVRPKFFFLHLKESEWRWRDSGRGCVGNSRPRNHRFDNLFSCSKTSA